MARRPDPQELRAARQALVHARGRRKLDVILDAPDPQGLVRSLPAQDLYFAIAEIGVADAGPLVQLAAPSQFRTFVDLGAWKRDELDPASVARWLDLARGDDDEAYRARVDALDLEIVELLLRASVQVFDLEEEEEPDVQGAVERSPDGHFLLVYPEGPVEFADARRLVAELYERDAFQASRMLSAVRWELESELTETALRWRTARLADLGFPSPEEAASLYARRPQRSTVRPEPPSEPAGFFLAALERGNLLDRALASMDAASRDRLERELVAVLNMALVADGVDVGDLDAVRAEGTAVRDTLALGLAVLGGEPAASLVHTPLKSVFQAGFTATLALRWRVDRLLGTLPLRLPSGDLLLDEPEDAVVRALLLRRPRFGGEGEVRPFESPRDLERAAAALDRAQATGEMLAAAGLEPGALAAALDAAQGAALLPLVQASQILATAAARRELGLSPSAGLLPALATPPDPARVEARLLELASGAEHHAAAEAVVARARAQLEAEPGATYLREG